VKAWQLIGSPDYSVTALQIRIYMGVQLARAYPQGGARQILGVLARPNRVPQLKKLNFPIRSDQNW